MCTEVNSVMGLQATAATKRKHEITFDGKEANTYTNCSPPLKVSKWSKNSSLAEALEEKLNSHNKYAECLRSATNNNNSINKNNNIISSIKNQKMVSNDLNSTTRKSNTTAVVPLSIINGNGVTKAALESHNKTGAAATTPLSPTASSPVLENSIAKLEEVAAAPCEPWHPTAEPVVDCISKLQAVAVPSDPWGGITTRSTLATTLLSADEIDDDDDDFEDDYEEEESIIPTYCPLRYHAFSGTPSSLQQQQQQRANSYTPTTHGYGSRPNYYSEPFPQQNCSRTGGPQHLRMSSNGAFTQWQPSGANGQPQQYYGVPTEADYSPPQQQQQTIRCAENGKSYLDLGCSTPASSNIDARLAASTPPPPPYSNMHVASAHETRHPLKRCCEGRGTWCNTNKSCYKDIRLKIRQLSMFKLSRFRQVSEQSLHRSVLICNTLKYIDREIEAETKEIHQAAHAHAHHHQHHQHTQYQHLHHPHHLQQQHHHNMLHHNQQHQQLQPLPHLQQQPTQHQEYSPVLSCSRVANMDYQSLQHQQQPQQPPPHFQQSPHHYQNGCERLEPNPPYLNSAPLPIQKSATAFASSNSNTNNSNNCDSGATSSASATLHPYDHYPFRESQSGRATPFPSQSAHSATPPAITSPTLTSAVNNATVSPANVNAINGLTEPDSRYGDDDCTRSINWSSVLSLSSQSALDPLNNNELFSIIPASSTSVSSSSSASSVANASAQTTSAEITAFQASASVAISGSFSSVQTASSTATAAPTTSAQRSANSNNNHTSATTTATFTTLSTISSATYSLTSSYASSLSQQVQQATHMSAPATWEYGFLDMDFGLGSEFTELMPSCKLSSDDLYKSGLTPVVASRYSSVHDNELEQPAHIMVGS